MGRTGTARARRVGMGAVALAVLVLAGCYTDKGTPPGLPSATAIDVAADGTILAGANVPNTNTNQTAVLRPDGTWIAIAPLPGFDFGLDARAINDAGVVVGGSIKNGGTTAIEAPFVWDAAHGTRPLDAVTGPVTGLPSDVGDGGHIVGTGTGATAHGWLWDPGTGTLIDLPPVAGQTTSSAQAVNASGAVVGQSGDRVPTLWAPPDHQPVALDVGTVPNTFARAVDIGDDGTIAGNQITNDLFSTRAVVWQAGPDHALVPLEDSVFPGLGFHPLSQAIRIDGDAVLGTAGVDGDGTHLVVWKLGDGTRVDLDNPGANVRAIDGDHIVGDKFVDTTTFASHVIEWARP